jgi:hypothetical protein
MPLERDTPDLAIQDKFQRVHFVDSVVDLLLDRNQQEARGFVVGLTGPWGSGKSQIMLFVEQRLRIVTGKDKKGQYPHRDRRVIVVRFNPWLYAGHQELLRNFFESIIDEVKRHDDPQLKKELVPALDTVKRYARPLTGLLGFVPVGGDAAKQVADSFLADSTLEAQKAEFTKRLTKTNASVVVLLDEIDRLSDQEVREVAQTVKAVADFPMFSYLLAYDPDRVARALGHDDLKLGFQYLEKIVQVQARLPRAAPGALAAEIQRQIVDVTDGRDSDQLAWAEAIRNLVPDIIATPRDGRRLTAAMALRWPKVQGEVNSIDLLRYCALEARVPILSERAQYKTERMTVDGSRELIRRLERLQPASECIDDILGEYRNDIVLRDLLVYLFPALRDDGTEEITRDEDRLCYETPLLALLNYGPVKGAITYDQARDALRDRSVLSQLLEDARAAGRLRHAVLRLRRAFRDWQLESAGASMEAQVDVIRCIGAYFDRAMPSAETNDWDSWLDLTHVFVRGALRNYIDGRFFDAKGVSAFLDDGLIHLPARILMFHLQAYGLGGVQKDALLTPTIPESEIPGLLEKASEKLSSVVLNASSEWKLRSVVPLWVIRGGDANGERWLSVRAFLAGAKSSETLDRVLILAMRYARDQFAGTTLLKELTVDRLAKGGLILQNPEPGLRTPTDRAYQFMRAQLRGNRDAVLEAPQR